MRIVIATGIFPPDIGGPATYSALLARELPKRNIGVSVVTYGSSFAKASEDKPSVISRKIPKGLRHLVYFFVCFMKALRADIVFAQDPVSAGLPALCASRLARRQFVVRVAGDYAWEQATQRYGVRDSIDDFQTKTYSRRVERLRRIQRLVVRRADLVITPSKYFQKLVQGWTNRQERVRVIYNGIELPILGRPDLPTEVRPPEILFSAGRLVPWKGFGALIELMKELPEWELRIAGEGPEQHELKVESEKLKVADRVTFLGAVSREKIWEELQNARVFALNTSFESFSYQVVEAMWAGAPAVTTNIGNLAEIIENGKEGILVEPDNRAELLSAIRRLDEDVGFRAAVIKAAREKAKQFSIQRTIENLVMALASLGK